MMIKKPFLVSLSCFFLGVVSSCSFIDARQSAISKDTAVVKSSKSSFYPGTASASTIKKAQKYSKDKHGMPTYKSNSVRTRYVRTTAYSHLEGEAGAHGLKSAAGTTLKYGNVRSAAADWSVYPLGTKFRVKGQPYTYVIDDYGSALVGTNTIDIFKPSLSSMRKWGTRKTEITVIQWGSYDRSICLLYTSPSPRDRG